MNERLRRKIIILWASEFIVVLFASLYWDQIWGKR